MSADYVTYAPERYSTPELSYPYPVSQMGCDSLQPVRTRVALGSTTTNGVTLSRAAGGGSAGASTGGGQVIVFRLGTGKANTWIDFRNLVFSCKVTSGVTAGNVIPYIGFAGGFIDQLRIKSNGQDLWQSTYYSRSVQAMLPYLSTNSLNQMKALDFLGVAVADSTTPIRFQHPLLCPLSSFEGLFPAAALQGEIIIEIQVVPGAGYVCSSGDNTGVVTLGYTDFELLYDEVALGGEYVNPFNMALREAGAVSLKCDGFNTASAPLSANATTASVTLVSKRAKTLMLWQTLSALANNTLNVVSRSSNGVSSYNVYVNGSPSFPRFQTVTIPTASQTVADAGDSLSQLLGSFRDLKDYWRGLRTTLSATEFVGNGQAAGVNYDVGPTYIVDLDTLNNNHRMLNNGIEIRAPVRFECQAGGVTADANLYLCVWSEVNFVITADGKIFVE